MSGDRHGRLSELYLQACDLDPTELDNFITEKCAGRPSLAEELRRMVGQDKEPPDILRTGSMARGLAPANVPIPKGIGPYRITELLGEGGMGIVYRATQDAPIRREVAVKLIKLGIETETVVQRFESERQTLALMNHPNIARVIDAGTTEYGRSYFAMEFVVGVPITHFCDDRRLTVHERLELFIKVCDGVQHAHHNGIIHRDIKPSNILVTTQDGKAVPKIIDFGVSKALDRGAAQRTMFTEVGQFLGTPEYMSPEQTEPDSRNVDTRTDVYALGVLLYELTTGTLPLDPRQLRQSHFGEV
ncbi:MAG: serine/threonine protein kinase, partial [Acidimicrobiia bacterium]|nr:serine/threonine protein kinase [Acidimicrobiia bacterium]